MRIGNKASTQFQLDVYGEVVDALHEARHRIPTQPAAWNLERALVRSVIDQWRKRDQGIWEVRGRKRHFTHSKVMAWVALDRGIKAVEKFHLDPPREGLDRWRAVRSEIHRTVLEKGYNGDRQSFTQSFGSTDLDASLLLIPRVGFLPPEDERVRNTVAAMQRELQVDEFVMRYLTGGEGAHDKGAHPVDGLRGGEGAFLVCSFWLADNLALVGRTDEARALFERLLRLQNDVGLLSEEYDPVTRQMLGNFPQAFSHVGLIGTARLLNQLTLEDGMMAIYAMMFTTVDDYVARRQPYRAEHLTNLTKLYHAGDVIIGGAWNDRIDGGIIAYRAETPAAVEEMVSADPYYRAGLWQDVSLRERGVVVGPGAPDSVT